LEYNPVDGKLYAGNDGGIYWTANNGTNWNEITNGLAIGQVYKLGQSETVKDKVINGYQDNGTSTFTGGTNWINNLGGDGMECAVDHQDAKYSYGTLYYGDIFRMTNNVGGFKIAGINTFGIDEDGGWVTPFILHETNATTMFVGFKNVWRGKNIRTNNPTWVKISANLGGVNSVNMRVLEQSPVNVNILYAARDDKKLFRTEQCNSQSTSWTDLSANLPENTSINDLEAHPYDENIVYLAQGTNLYKSTDKGLSWEEISGNLPNSNITSIAYYKNSQEGLYVSTDIGIFYKDAFLSEWILFGNAFPASSRVTEVEIYYDTLNPQNDAIRASTYGRGLWSSDMHHSTPTANFLADNTTVPINCPVTFTDHSPGVPTSWQWTFEGGNPATSNLPGPIEVIYENPGVFDVTLTISNDMGSDTKYYDDMIISSDQLVPEVSFSVEKRVVCTGAALQFTDQSLFCPNSWQWSFIPDDVVYLEGTTPDSQNPVVMFPGNSNYSVSLTVYNSNGSATLTEENYILSGGYQLPFTESFETNSFITKYWTIQNTDGLKTWEIATPIFAPDGEKAALINFHDYYKYGERDQLISPAINFEGESDAILTFKYAYAQRFNQKDSLIVYLSDDCGENWTRIYANGPDGSGIFETALPTASYFDPVNSSDWCGEGYGAECVTLPITLNSANSRLMFEGFNKYGNNLYLDEITISTTTKIPGILKNNEAIEIFPNPSSGNFAVIFNQPSLNLKVMIKNVQGKTLLTRSLSACSNNHSEFFDISTFPDGPYIIQVFTDDFMTNDIIIKQ
jgi:PKD repeat protein